MNRRRFAAALALDRMPGRHVERISAPRPVPAPRQEHCRLARRRLPTGIHPGAFSRTLDFRSAALLSALDGMYQRIARTEAMKTQVLFVSCDAALGSPAVLRN